MRSIITLAALAAAALPLAPATAQTMHGYTSGPTRVYSGPLRDYPRIRSLRSGAMVTVLGCLRDWTWCDVIYRGDRGWVAGNALRIRHEGRRRGIGADMGIGVTNFAFGSYWDNHYRGRQFYGQRQRWQSQYNNAYRPEWGEREQRRDEDSDHNRGRGRDRRHGEGQHGQDRHSDRQQREDVRHGDREHGNQAPRDQEHRDQEHRPMLNPQSMAQPYRFPEHGTTPAPADRQPRWSGTGNGSDTGTLSGIDIPGITRPVQININGDAPGQPHP